MKSIKYYYPAFAVCTQTLFARIYTIICSACLVAPLIAPFDFGDEASNVGEVAGVQCMVAKGDLPMDIFWSLNSVPIVSGEHSFLISRLNARTSALNIDSLGAKHRGLYQCIARNRAGFSEHESELHVNGKNKFR